MGIYSLPNIEGDISLSCESFSTIRRPQDAQRSKVLNLLTVLQLLDVVAFDGAGETEQLDQPAMFLYQSVDVATSQDLKIFTLNLHFTYYIKP